ncbi:hypothetical protein PENSPDRAFT_647322 [Peniophora sp. CONT]|nr:hypothetical protein PENSPDRAFT_647322 [Peniophora sp. CONT]
MHPTTLLSLPNELLIKIVEYLGPPDISCCDPGWLVLPAVCRHLRAVAESVPGWDSGTILGPGNIEAAYKWQYPDDWRTGRTGVSWFSPNTGTGTKECHVSDSQLGSWRFTPIYKGGSVECREGLLSLYDIRVKLDAEETGSEAGGESEEDDTDSEVEEAFKLLDRRTVIDRYFNLSSLHGQPPRLNYVWLTSLNLSCGIWNPNPNQSGVDFSFANVPLIVAPALQELYLNNYIIDWRSERLATLDIHIDGGTAPSYRYPPLLLFARLCDSRLTLEKLSLERCLSPTAELIETTAPAGSAFPRLCTFHLSAVHTAALWFCQRMTFSFGHTLAFTGPGFSATSLRHLAYAFSHPVTGRKQTETFPITPGEINTLTIREPGRLSGAKCTITASRSLSSYSDMRFNSELYARNRVSRLDRYGFGREITNLDKVTGLEPAFMTDVGWDVSEWEPLPLLDDKGPCTYRSSLLGVQQVFINGQEGRLFKRAPDIDSMIWTAVLRNLPNLRVLYIRAPSPATLAPLSAELNSLPELELLWLGRGPGEPKQDVDAGQLLDIIHRRSNLNTRNTGTGHTFRVHMENIRLVGDAAQVQEVHRLCEF